MSEKRRQLYIEILDFLNYEKEVYGDFTVNPENTEEQQTIASPEALSEQEEPLAGQAEEDPASDTPGQIKTATNINSDSTVKSKSSKKMPELFNESKQPGQQQEKPRSNNDENDLIKSCRTLEELKSLCEKSDDLKTDLEETNLVFGVGNPNADLILIGEAPGFYEDQQGEPFVGRAGQLLNKILAAINFEREEVYIANILKHRPPKNRDPKPEERQRSLPYLRRQIELIDPKLILCLGRVSATTLLDREDSLKNMRGRFHPFMDRLLMVTYHPAALLRHQQWKRPTWEDVQLLREKYDELTGNH